MYANPVMGEGGEELCGECIHVCPGTEEGREAVCRAECPGEYKASLCEENWWRCQGDPGGPHYIICQTED
jgi:hypothetical protein